MTITFRVRGAGERERNGECRHNGVSDRDRDRDLDRERARAAARVIRSVTFGSCYVYSPFGTGNVSERSRLLRSLLKEGDARFIAKYAIRVREQCADHSPLAGFLGAGQVLVPVPGSAPTRAAPVSLHLAEALIEAGLGQGIWQGLRRAHRVCKSGTAPPGLRPTVGTHYDSFAVESSIPPVAKLLLVDDVVTKGRTLLAAAARLKEAFPHAEIRAFAMLRTMGLVPGVEHLLDPCVGQIRWKSGDAERSP